MTAIEINTSEHQSEWNKLKDLIDTPVTDCFNFSASRVFDFTTLTVNQFRWVDVLKAKTGKFSLQNPDFYKGFQNEDYRKLNSIQISEGLIC